jgi:hypothetical protein
MSDSSKEQSPELVSEKEPSPKLETLRSTLGYVMNLDDVFPQTILCRKSAREIYRRARSSNQGRRTDDEKEMKPGVVRWAPQVRALRNFCTSTR